MIGIGSGVRVLVATKPVDFRKGADGLAALAKEALGQDPYSGTVIVFRARRADRVKIIAWDGSGLVMLWKALDQGAFKWPPISDGVMKLSTAELAARDCQEFRVWVGHNGREGDIPWLDGKTPRYLMRWKMLATAPSEIFRPKSSPMIRDSRSKLTWWE